MPPTKVSADFLAVHPSAQIKKMGANNFLDIHLSFVHEKKGTHLFFNTSGDKIKVVSISGKMSQLMNGVSNITQQKIGIGNH
jgi:hypothetical protein